MLTSDWLQVRNYEPCWNGTEAACGAALHTGHLNNLDYTACVQSEPGYCGISYRQVASIIFFTITNYFPRCQADPQAFQLSGLQGDNVPVPVNGEAACHDDYLYIPRGQHLDDVTQKYTEERYGSQQFYNKKPNHYPTKQKYFPPRKILFSAESLLILISAVND